MPKKKVGRYGKKKAPRVEELAFDYFEDEIRVHPDASDAVIFRFMARVGDMDADSPDAVPALMGFMTGLIHPEDWNTFINTAVKERQDVDDLMEVVGGIMEAMAERPTQLPTDSPDGPLPTPASSTQELSSLDIQHRYEQEGRPDLALVVQNVREARGA